MVKYLIKFVVINVWRLIVFAPFLIKSPKQSLGDLLFLLRFLLLLLFFFLSVHHELVHGRSQELQDKIFKMSAIFKMPAKTRHKNGG